MKKKAKKNRTPTEQVRHLKRIKRLSFGGMFLSVITPFVTIGIVNFNEYFVEYSGVKMSIAAVLAFALMGIAVWLVASKKFQEPFIGLLVGWATVTVIFFLMGKIINDIATIMLFGFIGLAGAYGLNIYEKKLDKEIASIQEGIEEAKKEATKEAYKEETKEETKKDKSEVRW